VLRKKAEGGEVKMRGTPKHYKKWMRKERGQKYKELVDKWKKASPEGKDPLGEVQAWNKKAKYAQRFYEGAKKGTIDKYKKAQGGEIKKDWIKGAVKKPGALRAIAEKRKLIKGKEKLSSSDLSKLGSQAKKSGNSLLAKRVSLAKTFAKMRKK